MIDPNKLHEIARSREASVTSLCRRLIATPSLSCQEGRVAEMVATEMEKASFDEVRIDLLGNVVGLIGKGPIKILLDAHLDTVDIGDRAEWAHDPFKGKLENGLIYGRGASDMKGALASMLLAGQLIKELGLDEGCQLCFVASLQEEDCEGAALSHVVKKQRTRPDYVVITEPSGMKLTRGQRGRIELKVMAKGRSCHASAPERGENAIYKMAPIIRDIEALNNHLGHDLFLGSGSVAVTCIDCQTPSVNAVPGECTIILDRRLTAGETMEMALEQIQSMESVRAAGARVEINRYEARTWKGFKVSQEKYFPSWVLPEEHLLVQAGIAAARIALGREPVVGKWAFSTNGVATMGRLGIPTIGFGPASESMPHTAGECVAIDDLVRSAIFYAILGPVLAGMSQRK